MSERRTVAVWLGGTLEADVDRLSVIPDGQRIAPADAVYGRPESRSIRRA